MPALNEATKNARCLKPNLRAPPGKDATTLLAINVIGEWWQLKNLARRAQRRPGLSKARETTSSVDSSPVTASRPNSSPIEQSGPCSEQDILLSTSSWYEKSSLSSLNTFNPSLASADIAVCTPRVRPLPAVVALFDMRVWLRVLLLKLSDLTPRATSFSIYAPHAPHANLTEVSDAALSGVYRWVASMKKPMMKYAFAPDLCEVLHPLISEAVSWSDWVPFLQPNFTRCDRLEHVLRTSFTIWQAASPALHFVDVTARCEAERLWAPIDQNHCTTSPWCLAVENQTQPHDKVANPEWVSWIEDQTPLELADPESDTCSHRTCWDCARADVVIGAFSQKRRLLGDQHARARVVRNGMLEMRPFGADGLPKPGGQLGRRGRTSEAATFLQFNADHAYMDNGTEVGKCWKIDSDLCDWLAASAVDGVDIKHSATVFFALVFSLAVCCCCYASCFCLGKLAYNLLSGYDLDDDGKLSFQELTYVLDEFIGDLCFTCTCPTVHDKKVSPLAGAITALETLQNLPVAAITFSVFTAIGVFILYSLELRMCLDCWDLAAAAHHEVGHLLSLDHLRVSPTPPSASPASTRPGSTSRRPPHHRRTFTAFSSGTRTACRPRRRRLRRRHAPTRCRRRLPPRRQQS